MSAKWDIRFLELADLASTWSKDNNTKVGAVVVGPAREVLATCYNGMPIGVDDSVEERYVYPLKGFFTEHAERNCIAQAARQGISLKDCTVYISSQPRIIPPCAECARMLIQAGIRRVVHRKITEAEPLKQRWSDSCAAGAIMFREAGVIVDILG